MKIIIYDEKAHVVKSINDPFNSELEDIIVKPNSNVLKLIYKNRNIIEYYLVNRTYSVNHDLSLDVDEFKMVFHVDLTRNGAWIV